MADRLTVQQIRKLKARGEKLSVVTAYDATFARILDDAGADALLIGDSLGMVFQGHESTLPVTLDQMVYHCAAVARGSKRAHLVGDLPFMSYQASVEDGIRSAGRLVAEGGVGSVKLEGGEPLAETVLRIVGAGIPVMGHVGLTPQSVHALGGFVVQGREEKAARQIVNDAVALEQAGAYAVVLEGIPLELAREVTERLSIPTVGIGAGPHCDGQVLVCYDLLGMNPDFKPRFVKRYAELYAQVRGAVASFSAEVKAGEFPREEHAFKAGTLQLVEPAGPAAGKVP
ncbi:MAG TPA: 3-methyl-2-oxobutanoate hydroxymethyltransferase [Myxococcaceae bacterium]|nr:3-methyl-2-oxobutanoate hydroxymethyltransferase [Myxococcaceae bacterium]